jgi:hypothetical protein
MQTVYSLFILSLEFVMCAVTKEKQADIPEECGAHLQVHTRLFLAFIVP